MRPSPTDLPSGTAGGERDLEKGIVAQLSPPYIASPRAPPVVVSNSSKSLGTSNSGKALAVSNSGKVLAVSNSGKALAVSNSGKSLISNTEKSLPLSNSSKSFSVSNSGKKIDQLGKKKYVKQVTGRQNDTELHLAVHRGDVGALREILGEINERMLCTSSNGDCDAEVAQIKSALVNEVNESGETALFIAAEKGHVEIVRELLQYTSIEGIRIKNRSGFDPFHMAAIGGHQDIVEILLQHDPELCKTVAQSNATPLISAVIKGHVAIVNQILSKDSGSLGMSKSNGKNALHFAARQGHVEIVKALLQKDPKLARRTDRKGQTALHMAVKGVSCPVVKCLLEEDPAVVTLPDKLGNTALHMATRKKRVEIVNTLLMLGDTNVNVFTKDNKTALDIAEGLPLSEETAEIKECLIRFGGVRANALNQAPDELRNFVREIRKDVHTQLEQARKTNRNMSGIAKELRKLHREGINNATNSVTVVAVLFATVAFAAIFTVPGGDDDEGKAVMSGHPAFRIFFLSNAVALFTSLAVVVVQITVVRGEIKSERKVVEVINKLMWLASICTTVAFLSSSYIVLGTHYKWAAISVNVIGGVIMAGVLGSMTYYVLKSRRLRKARKREKAFKNSQLSDFSEAETNQIYAI